MDIIDTYTKTSSSFPMGTHEMFPRIVSRWDVWLSNHPCRWQSAQKRQKEKKIIFQKQNITSGHLYTICTGE